MNPLTEAEILERGDASRALLESQPIMDGLMRISTRLTDDWRRSARSAHTLRDEIHAQVTAIDSLVSLWKRDVEAADFIRAKAAKRDRR